jgi:hypothetical protein
VLYAETGLTLNMKKTWRKRMSKSEKAFEIQERIGKLIDKLDKLGFEFMFYNRQSSIRRKRDKSEYK